MNIFLSQLKKGLTMLGKNNHNRFDFIKVKQNKTEVLRFNNLLNLIQARCLGEGVVQWVNRAKIPSIRELWREQIKPETGLVYENQP